MSGDFCVVVFDDGLDYDHTDDDQDDGLQNGRAGLESAFVRGKEGKRKSGRKTHKDDSHHDAANPPPLPRVPRMHDRLLDVRQARLHVLLDRDGVLLDLDDLDVLRVDEDGHLEVHREPSAGGKGREEGGGEDERRRRAERAR